VQGYNGQEEGWVEGETRSLTNEVRKSRFAGKATQFREAEGGVGEKMIIFGYRNY